MNYHYLHCPRNGLLKLQPTCIVVSSCGVAALNNINSKEIDLCSNYTINEL